MRQVCDFPGDVLSRICVDFSGVGEAVCAAPVQHWAGMEVCFERAFRRGKASVQTEQAIWFCIGLAPRL